MNDAGGNGGNWFVLSRRPRTGRARRVDRRLRSRRERLDAGRLGCVRARRRHRRRGRARQSGQRRCGAERQSVRRRVRQQPGPPAHTGRCVVDGDRYGQAEPAVRHRRRQQRPSSTSTPTSIRKGRSRTRRGRSGASTCRRRRRRRSRPTSAVRAASRCCPTGAWRCPTIATTASCCSIRRPASVTTLAGSGCAGYADGQGTSAQFNTPYGLVVRADGTLVVADYGNHRLRTVALDGTVGTLAGDGVNGMIDGDVAQARFFWPEDVAIDGSGAIYVSDHGNHRIRRLRRRHACRRWRATEPPATPTAPATCAEFYRPGRHRGDAGRPSRSTSPTAPAATPRPTTACARFRWPAPRTDRRAPRQCPTYNVGMAGPASDAPARVRLDKWLWAARFFKTRSAAAQAVDGGKIDVNGERAKRAHQVQAGETITVRRPPHELHVVVRALADVRGLGGDRGDAVRGDRRQPRGAREARLSVEERADADVPGRRPAHQARSARDRAAQEPMVAAGDARGGAADALELPPVTLVALEVEPLSVPLRDPFVIASGRIDVTRAALVRATVEDAAGRRAGGLGEAAALPPVTREDQPDLLAAIADAAPALVGLRLRLEDRSADRWDGAGVGGRARAARQRGRARRRRDRDPGRLVPRRRRAGGARAGRLGAARRGAARSDRHHAADLGSRAHGRGGAPPSRRRLRLLQGQGRPRLARRSRVAARGRGAAIPGARFRLDANAGFSAADALALLDAVLADGLARRMLRAAVRGRRSRRHGRGHRALAGAGGRRRIVSRRRRSRSHRRLRAPRTA